MGFQLTVFKNVPYRFLTGKKARKWQAMRIQQWPCANLAHSVTFQQMLLRWFEKPVRVFSIRLGNKYIKATSLEYAGQANPHLLNTESILSPSCSGVWSITKLITINEIATILLRDKWQAELLDPGYSCRTQRADVPSWAAQSSPTAGNHQIECD